MPIDRIFTGGSLAKMYIEVAEWQGRHTLDIRGRSTSQPFTVLVPFTGFSRMASAMCDNGVAIDTCDYQRLSAVIVDGILTAKEVKTNVDKPRFHKGRAYAGKLFQGSNQPDERSAGFIDWVVMAGTAFDIACMGMSIPSQTMRGWMGKWTGNFDSLYTKFQKTQEACAEFVNMPGSWTHFEADFFDIEGLRPRYNVIAVDPPRLSGPTSKDAYTTGSWWRLNYVLHGEASVKPWNHRNYIHALRQVLDIDSDYIIFTWQEGFPELRTIRSLVTSYGELEDTAHWESYNKSIHGWRVKRHGTN